MIQGRLCKAGYQPAVDKAVALFRDYIESNKQIHADLRLTVFAAAVRSGTEKVRAGFDDW